MKDLTFITEARTENTGGNCMNDILTLEDNTCLVISEDMICWYADKDSYENGEEPTRYIDRF